MSECKNCRQSAASRCAKGLCGHCCIPRCAEGVHNARHSIRGVEGVRRRKKWSAFWEQAMGLATRWLECGLCRHWSGFYILDFRATRKIFLNELKVLVQADAGEIIRDSHPVIGAVCPPCELENIVAYLKENFSQQQVREAEDGELDEEDFCVGSTDHASATSFHEPPGLSVDTVLQVTTEQTGAKDGARHDHEMPSKDVARHSWDCHPPNVAMFELPANAPKDRLATKDGVPCSHYRREWPPICHQASKKWPLRLVNSPLETMYVLAQSILEQWFQKRLDLDQVLDKPVVKQYNWSPGSGEVLDLSLHSWGRWFWCGVRKNQWVPLPPEGTDFESRTLHGVPFETFIHTSSMYIVHRAMIGGLMPGTEAGKCGLVGVYAFRPIGNRAAVASSGYAVYSDLATNGLYFSPRFELAVNTAKASNDGVKMSAGNQQYAVPDGYYHITGLWIHCLSGNDIKEGKSSSWTPLDDWHPECELNARRRPQDACEDPSRAFQ